MIFARESLQRAAIAIAVLLAWPSSFGVQQPPINQFIGPAGGSWFVPDHWSEGVLPVDHIAQSGLPIEIDGPNAQALVVECTVNNSGYTILAGLGASLTTEHQKIAAVEGIASVTQFGGTNSPGLLAIGVEGNGQYIQYGGSLVGEWFEIGTSFGAMSFGGEGLYERFGGNATGTVLLMGHYDGAGVFRQHAGTTTFGGVNIGAQGGGTSRLEILGGSFSCSGAVVGGELGQGIVTVETATWNVSGNMTFGEEQAWGILKVLDGGVVNAGSASVAEGTEGSATFLVHGAGSSLDIAGELIGAELGTRATIEIFEGGTMTTGQTQLGGLAHQFFGGSKLVIDGAGSLWIDSGAVFELRSWNGTYDNATLRLSDGGRLETPKFKPINAFVYGDDGFIDGKLVNLGICSPGISPSSPPHLALPSFGVLTVETLYVGKGVYIDNSGQTIDATGTLRIELGGYAPAPEGEHDVLNVAGEFRGGGELAVELVNGFDPPLGSTFDVVQYGSFTEPFETLTLPVFPDNRDMDVEYVGGPGSPGVVRVVVTTNCLCDFDGSDTVDVNDLLLLLDAWGPCAPPCEPDVAFDGVVTVNDLLIVINSWGACFK